MARMQRGVEHGARVPGDPRPPAARGDAAPDHRERHGFSCPVCGSADTRPLLEKRGYAIVHCGACDLAFHPSAPSSTELAALYSTRYFTGGGFEGYPDYLADEPAHRRQARYYLRRLHRLTADRGVLLDVGCAAGFFLDEARRAGWTVRGCDISRYAAGIARERFDLDVRCGSFLDADFAPASCDLVTMFSVIAHLPHQHEVERRLHDVVRPGGLVVIETTNWRSWVARLLGGSWQQWSPPSVLHYHTRSSLSALFDRSRWELVSYRPSQKWITWDHALSRVQHRIAAPSGARLVQAMRRVAPQSLAIPYPLGDIALAAFRRIGSSRDASSGRTSDD